MKNGFLVLLIMLCLGQSACERDDICAETTPTTPLLVINFLDVDNPVEEKIPANLAIIEEGETNFDNVRFFNSATIEIPLRTDANQTSYEFILNSIEDEESEEEPNNDLLTFSYGLDEEFVSKACGFRVTYNELTIQAQGGEDNDWIQNIEILNSIVVNDTITHVRILH